MKNRLIKIEKEEANIGGVSFLCYNILVKVGEIMKNARLGFVILHYQAIKETISCIQSIIQRIDTKNYEIVVVDNGSPNCSGEKLKRKYEKDRKVHVILTGNNLGFSAGNNVGFQYAKEQLGCDFICMTNNDTEIIQDDFFQVIIKEYENSHFAVLGPEIYLEDGSICEYPKTILKLNEIEQDRQRVKRLIIKNKLFIESIHLTLYKYISQLIQWKKIRHHFRDVKAADPRMEKVRLHGCCMVFSPIYIEKFDGLEVRTHFYGEEDILFVRLVRNHMKSVYLPELKIFHHEEAATSLRMGRDYKKRRFIYETHLETLDMLEKMYREDLDSLKDYIY